MRRRLADDRGFIVPAAIAVLLIVTVLVGVAVAYSARNVGRSNYDRYSARALAAADAGLDTAGWRMNTLLVGSVISGLTSDSSNSLLNLGCVDLTVTGQVTTGSGSWCAPPLGTSWESVDQEGSTATGEQFRYFTQLVAGLNLSNLSSPVDPGNLLKACNAPRAGVCLERRIVVVGRANNRYARVIGKYQIELDKILDGAALAKLRLFGLARYVQCPSSGFSDSDPASGCPSI